MGNSPGLLSRPPYATFCAAAYCLSETPLTPARHPSIGELLNKRNRVLERLFGDGR